MFSRQLGNIMNVSCVCSCGVIYRPFAMILALIKYSSTRGTRLALPRYLWGNLLVCVILVQCHVHITARAMFFFFFFFFFY